MIDDINKLATWKKFADQLAEDIHNYDYDPDEETFNVEGAARRIEAAIIAALREGVRK